MQTSSMEKVIAKADREILVEIVRLAQKLGMKGDKGGWKEFLDNTDKKFGSSLSDPRKRSVDILASFLRSFTAKEDLKFFRKSLRSLRARKIIIQHAKDSLDAESPEQMLVRVTIDHPQFVHYYSFPVCDEEWMVTKLGKSSTAINMNRMIAIDCEMVLCEDGSEGVVKLCAVDSNLEVVLDSLVKPCKAVVDFRTEITGISAKDLEGVTCSLKDIQRTLKKLLSHGTILVGHSLHNDLLALKMDHARVIDTQLIFKFQDFSIGTKPSLNNLCKAVLGYDVREEGAPHNCLDDAFAAMKLVLAKLEHGFDDSIVIGMKDVPKSGLEKLFLHKMGVHIPSKVLLKTFSKHNIVEIQRNPRAQGHLQSAYAIFRDLKDAQGAFDSIEGKEEKDSYGRPQKLVSLKLSSGCLATFYVRKMTPDNPLPHKRPAEEDFTDLKRPKTDCPQCEHYVEIEKLKQEIRRKDDEIRTLHEMLSAST